MVPNVGVGAAELEKELLEEGLLEEELLEDELVGVLAEDETVGALDVTMDELDGVSLELVIETLEMTVELVDETVGESVGADEVTVGVADGFTSRKASKVSL